MRISHISFIAEEHPHASETASSQDPADATDSAEGEQRRKTPLGVLMLSALGVVYGDIGTSPLYAMRETFHHSFGLTPNPATLLGLLSLITWSLILIVSLKYLAFVMRADLHGEGGILTLTGLVNKTAPDPSRRSIVALTFLGLFGTALLYGEGIITPAISVLSAVEGLNVATDRFENQILPITVVILIALFSIQSRGTEKVGRIFGPITLLWFITLFSLGLYHIKQEPPLRVEGTGVFLSGAPHRAPPALLNSLKHYHVLHQKVVLVSVSISDRSHVDAPYRIRCEQLGEGFYQVRLRFGYMERCDVPGALALIPELDLRPAQTTYYLGREVVIPTVGGEMAVWREKLFAVLSQNAANATAFFHIPPDRVIEIGSQVCI